MGNIDFLYNPYVLLFFSFWIFWTIYFVFNLYLFFKNKESFYIKSRAPWLIFCSAIGQYLMMTSLTFKILVTPARFPNFVSHWYIWLFIPCHMFPYPIRSLRFIIRYKVNKTPELTEEERANAPCDLKFWDWFRRHPNFLTDTAFLILNWILVAIAFFVGVGKYVNDPNSHPGHYGSCNSVTFFVWCICLLVFINVFHWVAFYYISKFHDKLYYNVELAIVGSVWFIFMALYIILGWAEVKPPEVQPIMGILLCVFSFLVSFGFPIQLAVTKPSNIDYGSVMKHMEQVMEPHENDEYMKKAKKLFKDFCEKRQCVEGFFFYDAVIKFRKEGDPAKRIDLFRKIKERFIMKNAIWHINVLGKTLNEILDMNEEYINNEALNEAFNDNKRVLETDQFSKFKSTKIAKDLINEILRKKNVLVGYGPKNRRRNDHKTTINNNVDKYNNHSNNDHNNNNNNDNKFNTA